MYVFLTIRMTMIKKQFRLYLIFLKFSLKLFPAWFQIEKN